MRFQGYCVAWWLVTRDGYRQRVQKTDQVIAFAHGKRQRLTLGKTAPVDFLIHGSFQRWHTAVVHVWSGVGYVAQRRCTKQSDIRGVMRDRKATKCRYVRLDADLSTQSINGKRLRCHTLQQIG